MSSSETHSFDRCLPLPLNPGNYRSDDTNTHASRPVCAVEVEKLVYGVSLITAD